MTPTRNRTNPLIQRLGFEVAPKQFVAIIHQMCEHQNDVYCNRFAQWLKKENWSLSISHCFILLEPGLCKYNYMFQIREQLESMTFVLYGISEPEWFMLIWTQ